MNSDIIDEEEEYYIGPENSMFHQMDSKSTLDS